MTITEFLLARIAEDEEAARAADVKQGDPDWKVCEVALSWPRAKRVRSARDNRPIAYVEDVAGDDAADTTGILNGAAVAEHIARHDPARVLAECEAKRRIVELSWHHLGDEEYGWGMEEAKRQVLAILALPYADHPEFQEEWRA